MAFDDLVLMPEVSARRLLVDRRVLLSVLAPLGSFAGRGTLRVLRARPAADQEQESVELVCGYDAYEPVSESA